jgi:predicted pyridoxine 5'-phosphate oxidase superfamily flavin-nucleotide-binding protein
VQAGTAQNFTTLRTGLLLLYSGDGIGPEISEAVKAIFKAAGAPIVWDEQHLGKTVDERTNSFVTRENLDSVLVSCPCSVAHHGSHKSHLTIAFGAFAEAQDRSEGPHDHTNWQGFQVPQPDPAQGAAAVCKRAPLLQLARLQDQV